MLAFNPKLSFIFNSTDVLSKLTPITFTTCTSSFFTVISHVALKFPSFVVTVIVAFPTPTAVTFPFASTFAIFSSLDVHVTSLFVASAGEMLAFNPKLSFIFNSADVLSKLTPVTFTSSLSCNFSISAESLTLSLWPSGSSDASPIAEILSPTLILAFHSSSTPGFLLLRT